MPHSLLGVARSFALPSSSCAPPLPLSSRVPPQPRGLRAERERAQASSRPPPARAPPPHCMFQRTRYSFLLASFPILARSLAPSQPEPGSPFQSCEFSSDGWAVRSLDRYRRPSPGGEGREHDEGHARQAANAAKICDVVKSESCKTLL